MTRIIQKWKIIKLITVIVFVLHILTEANTENDRKIDQLQPWRSHQSGK